MNLSSVVTRRTLSTRLRRSGAALTSSTASSALCMGRRGYFWPYTDDFVPKGESTSRFQSSSVPSVRERIIREYALGPLFGDRPLCCTLGFADSARDVMGRKAALREALAVLFSASSADEITFGPLQQTKEMLLLRPDTSETPRLADGPRSRSDSALRRRSRYARAPVQARTVMDVFFDPLESGRQSPSASSPVETATTRAVGHAPVGAEADDDDDDVDVTATALGRLVQEELEKPSASEDASPSSDVAQQEAAAARLRALGVVYCELPEEDVSDYVFDTLHGAPVDDGMLERIADRWERRLQQLQEQGIDARGVTTASTASHAE